MVTWQPEFLHSCRRMYHKLRTNQLHSVVHGGMTHIYNSSYFAVLNVNVRQKVSAGSAVIQKYCAEERHWNKINFVYKSMEAGLSPVRSHKTW